MTDVYRNLNRRCWSVREGGRVVAHVSSIALADVTFRASEPARLRLLRTRAREVHAWARGRVVALARPADAMPVWYRPLDCPSFQTSSGPVRKARLAFFESDGTAWAVEVCDEAMDCQRPAPRFQSLRLGAAACA